MSIIEKAVDKLAGKDVDLVDTSPAVSPEEYPLGEGGGGGGSKAKARPLLKVDVFTKLAEQGFNLTAIEKKQIKEEFRHIKRPLLRTAAGLGADVVDNGNVIMIASTLAGEGKTFTAVNLAYSMAMERDKTVLLVDADMERSGLSHFFGVASEPGLIDYLQGRTDVLADVIFSTDLDSLKILPAGRHCEHATELYSSGSMISLMEEISQRYSDRVIVLDLPPLLLTSEAIVLASMAGQIVMVIESGSSQTEVKEAVGLFDPSQIIGLVMNKFSGDSRTYYYGGPVADE